MTMTDGPTTMNGPLHTDAANLDDRAMVASFATPEAARAARDALINAGIDASRISVVDDAAGDAGVQAAAQPADRSIIGRIREAVLPEDSETGTRAAARNNEALLKLRPLPQEVETAVQVLQAAKPSHFDADLERWRNAS
jgi:hypothetical protein